MNKTAGGVIAIVVAVSLCLAIFGALAISSAYADIALSDRMGETITAYYDADARAQQELNSISQTLRVIYSDSRNETDFVAKVLSLIDGTHADGETIYISFEQSVNDRQWIDVTISTAYEMQGGYNTESYLLTSEGLIIDKPLDLWGS
jgi:hypothetical protein